MKMEFKKDVMKDRTAMPVLVRMPSCKTPEKGNKRRAARLINTHKLSVVDVMSTPWTLSTSSKTGSDMCSSHLDTDKLDRITKGIISAINARPGGCVFWPNCDFVRLIRTYIMTTTAI